MKGFVLDSYALIAYFEDESGAARVAQILGQAEDGRLSLVMSVVNWGEVYYSMFRSKGEKAAEECLLVIEQLPVKMIDADRDIAYRAARLKAEHPIALGDCFAAALSIKTGFPVITGDREFKELGNEVKVEWL